MLGILGRGRKGPKACMCPAHLRNMSEDVGMAGGSKEDGSRRGGQRGKGGACSAGVSRPFQRLLPWQGSEQRNEATGEMLLKDHQAAVLPTVLEHQGCGKVGDRLKDYGHNPVGE